MNILFLTTKYHNWMASDLAEALQKRGHSVHVLLLDWDAKPGNPTRVSTVDGVKVVEVAPRATRRFGLLGYRISKVLLSARHADREMARTIDVTRFHALVAFTPASALAGPLRRARAIAARILFIFDFYPIHQREIGMISNGPIFRLAMRREESLYRTFTTLICNLPRNIQYLRKHFRLSPGQHVTSTPLWSDISPVAVGPCGAVRNQHGLPLHRPIAIFGGQITQGRGVEFMLEAARHAEAAGSPILFLFVGDGRLAETVDQRAEESGNVRRLDGLPREDYLRLATVCDVGMVATVPGVSSFSFPTKTIDYLRAGLPVVAAVEPGNDYLDILTKWGVGSGVAFDDPEGYFRAAAELLENSRFKASFADNARRCLDEVFDVEHAVKKVLEAVSRQHGDVQAARRAAGTSGMPTSLCA